jgi:ribosomal protein L9
MKRFIIRIRFLILAIFFLIGTIISGYFVYYYIDNPNVSSTYSIVFLSIALLCVIGTSTSLFIYISSKKDEKIKDLDLKLQKWTNISYHVSEAGDETFNKLPIGIVIYDNYNQIAWANNYSKERFGDVLDKSVSTISEKLLDAVKNSVPDLTFEYNDKFYDALHNYENQVFYFFDSTERENVKKRYNERITAIGIIEIDNLEESLKKFDMQEKANIRGQILGEISDYMTNHKCYFQTLLGDRMTVTMDKYALMQMIDDKFSMLDRIREITDKNRLKASVSMGLACYDNMYDDLGQIAQNAIDLATKRGGDQVVVNLEGEQIKFFGAKNNSLEKNTLVEARMQTISLKEQVENASNVLLMCHKFADTDAIGSMLAAFHMIKTSNVDAKMVFDPTLADSTVKKIYEMLKAEPMVSGFFVNYNDALEFINPQTLLLITDTQSPSLAMFPELLKKIKNVSIIDHHRPGEIGYENPLTYYLDSSASSATELVSEMFMFYNSGITMLPIEASIMLAGIIVDTNNFTQRSGARTFEAAATLKEYGADMIFVRKLLQEPLESEKFLNNAIANAELFGNRFSIVCLNETDKIPDRTTLAKISDQQLHIQGVEASFTIGRIDDITVGISARALGDSVNVQTIMEQMGGGGHFNSAATQRKNVSIQSLKDELTNIIRIEYIDGGSEVMKVILIQDVKSKGKKGEIIDVPNGYGNFLINNKQALAATVENLAKYEEEKEKERQIAENNRKLLLKFRDDIQGKKIVIKLKIGQGGKKFGSVTPKLVCDEFEAQTGIHLDKRKVELPAEINSIGIFTATVKLDTDIVAQFEIKVEGQE